MKIPQSHPWRGKPLRKKRKMKSPVDKAKVICEQSWKDAIVRRDEFCQVHGTTCTGGPLQADHFQSRRHGATFFDPRNGTLVCAGANQAKANGWHNMGYIIGRIVEKREGSEAVDELIRISKLEKKWTVMDLEKQTEYLNGLWIAQKGK